MAALNLANMQGDLFSRGFPKYNETYYFFSIMPGKEKDFSKALAVLGKSGQISSLEKVREDWCKIGDSENVIVPVSNALIAFSKIDLDKIQIALPHAALSLDSVKKSDPAFAAGMAVDGPKNLNDPPLAKWDPLFNTDPVHGILKVAGNSPEIVNSKLDDIKSILGHPTIIADIAAQSPPTTTNSRLDGQVRPRDQDLKGHEHFGFRDGVSQPLLNGIDTDAAFNKTKSMQTAQNVITVTDNPPPALEGLKEKAYPKKRPGWMVEGSFLVFRKLEQNVQGFLDLTDKFASGASANADQFGAKLMGRWKSGAPIALFPDQDATSDPFANNDFIFDDDQKHVCPLAAHIRKMNPRDGLDKTEYARMIRNGIPYGTEFSVDKTGKRGLLFACYQSSIDNGFKFVQRTWANNPNFPQWETFSGYDPLIGQPPNDGDLHITMFDTNETDVTPGLGKFPKLVTMKGGEYFFVPSISALSNPLGSA